MILCVNTSRACRLLQSHETSNSNLKNNEICKAEAGTEACPRFISISLSLSLTVFSLYVLESSRHLTKHYFYTAARGSCSTNMYYFILQVDTKIKRRKIVNTWTQQIHSCCWPGVMLFKFVWFFCVQFEWMNGLNECALEFFIVQKIVESRNM